MTVPLEPISDQFSAELEAIRGAFDLCVVHPEVDAASVTYRPGEDGCIVSAWDAWNRFMREILLTSAGGPTVGAAGVVYNPTAPRPRPTALAYLRQSVKGTRIKFTRSEPNWYMPAATSDFATTLGLANSSSILAAVGSSRVQVSAIAITSNPLNELRLMRNYIAHKNAETRADILPLLSPGSSPHEHARETVQGGVKRFDDWLDALVAISEAAVS